MEETKPLLTSRYSNEDGNVNIAENQYQHQKDVSDIKDDDRLSGIGSTCSTESTTEEYQTYWYRWYICVVVSLMNLLCGVIFNTWGPVDESAEAAFDFTTSEIVLLTNWGPIGFLISMPFFIWCMANKGLRLSNLVTAFSMALGSGLRCLPIDASVLRYFMHAGQFFNGIANCVVMAAPPFVSNVWFPPHERITATGVMTLMNSLGTGVAFAVALIVDVPSDRSKNYTECVHATSHPNNSCQEIIHIRGQINHILYVEFALSMAVFLSMLIFFPNRPPKPPSVSASLPRINLKAVLMELRHHKQFQVVATVIALVIGTFSAWISVLPIILQPLGISQSESSLMGLVMSIAGSLVGMLVGWFTDRLKGRMKLMFTTILSLALVDFTYFIIITNKWIDVIPFKPGNVEIWIAVVLLGTVINASIPVAVEMSADSAYPISEGTSTSIVVWVFNALSFILLLILGFLPNPLDANYIIFSGLLVSVPGLIFLTKEENIRLGLDTRQLSAPSASNKSTLRNSLTYGSVNGQIKD